MQLAHLGLVGAGGLRLRPLGAARPPGARALRTRLLPVLRVRGDQPPLRRRSPARLAGLRRGARPPAGARPRGGARAALPDHRLRLHPGPRDRLRLAARPLAAPPGAGAAVPRGEAAAGLALALAGAVAGLVQLIPAPGTSFAPGWRFGWDPAHAAQVLRMPWRAFVPLPRPGLHFWNTQPARRLARPAGAGGAADAGAGRRPSLAPQGGPGGLRPRRRRHSRLRLRQVRRRAAPPGPPVAPLRGGPLAGRRFSRKTAAPGAPGLSWSS